MFTDEGQFSSWKELILQISGINDYVLYIFPTVFIALNAVCWSSRKQKFSWQIQSEQYMFRGGGTCFLSL